jgi:hypothetical protein
MRMTIEKLISAMFISDHAMLLDFDWDVTAFASQPLWQIWEREGRRRRPRGHGRRNSVKARRRAGLAAPQKGSSPAKSQSCELPGSVRYRCSVEAA